VKTPRYLRARHSLPVESPDILHNGHRYRHVPFLPERRPAATGRIKTDWQLGNIQAAAPMPITSPGNDDDTGENHQPTLRKNTAEPVEQTLKQNNPAAVTRPDIEPMVAEIFARTPNGCGHRQIRMCLVHEFGVRVSHKSVLKVMRRMGLECRIRRPNPYRKYSSYRDETGARAENLLNRDFTADRPWVKLGTDVTEFRVADGKAYPAPVCDMGSKEIVAWDVSRHPDMAQQRRLLAMLEEKLPEDADPIPHSD